MNYLKRLNFSKEQINNLLTAYKHTPYLQRHRLEHIYYRVQMVALVFAVLTPLWIIVDYLTLPWPVWGKLAALRLIATFIFIAIAWPRDEQSTTKYAFVMLTTILFIPPVFYMLTIPGIALDIELSTRALQFASLYALLPLIVLAGLSLFPLTVLEVLLFGVPMLLISVFSMTIDPTIAEDSVFAISWLAFLLLCSSGFSSINQLRYMITLVSSASHDPLTGVYTRRSGREIIDIQYRVASRQGSTFGIIFLDIDNFKSVNDEFGHQVGDKVLIQFCDAMRGYLRASDAIVRWGGEEFVIVIPNTSSEGLQKITNRFISGWFGNRPDGSQLTASIGVAERAADVVDDWPLLIEIADKRMYDAKSKGRQRAIFLYDEELS